MFIYTNINVNTRTYSKADFKKLISEAYSEFSHTSMKKIFAKIVHAFLLMMLSPDMPHNVLRVRLIRSIELNTKFVVSLALESIIYKKKQNKKQV